MRWFVLWAKKNKSSCFYKAGHPLNFRQGIFSVIPFSGFIGFLRILSSHGIVVNNLQIIDISPSYSGSPLLVVESAMRWKRYPRKKQDRQKSGSLPGWGSIGNRYSIAVMPNSTPVPFSTRLQWRVLLCFELVGASKISGVTEPAATVKIPMMKEPALIE